MAAQEISHYRIIEKLGSGGMGEVFLAQDTKLERKVAIKMLPAKSIDDARARSRLFREARAAATLDHPNICSIHEVNEEGDSLFIVMQYVEGKTLAATLEDSTLTHDEVIDVGIQVAGALSEAHRRGVIHRDIKPANVIITPRGQVKVLDFGLARVTQTEQTTDPEARTLTQLTEEGYIVGTVAYMSPEQLKGQAVDARSDLFSLGVMLYQCAAGMLPFTGSSKIEISSKVLQVEPRKPSELNPGIPQGLEKIILKAMAKEVGDRYQTADEVLQDLRHLRTSLSGATELLPSVSRHPSAAGVVQKALRLRWVQILLVAVPVLVIATWIALRLWHSAPYEPTAAAKNYYDKGVDALHAATYFQASKVLKQSVDLDPQYAPAHARLAEAYLEINNTEQAAQEVLQAGSLAGRRALASADRLELDAIDAMARRDFPAAIGSYQKILNQAAASDKAIAHVDLGRAYERNEQLDKAIENYLNATKVDPQSAGASLRLGMAYSRRRDAQNATAAFDRSEQIYGVLANHEGLVEVVFQRGVLFYGAGKLADARVQFEKVLEMLKSQENNYQLTRTQLELSLVCRDEGDISRAKELAAEAIRVAQNGDIKNVATNGLIDLGLAFLSSGDFDEAGNYFQQALELARRDNSTATPTATEMRAHLSLGRLHFEKSNNDEAISELKPALDFYKKAGYRRETSVALTLLGRAYQDKGEDETALQYFEEQFQLVTKAGDVSGLADSHMSLALLKGVNQERYTEGLSHLDEKLKIDESRKSDRGKAFDQMNRGNLLWQLGRYDEARAALDSALEIATRQEAQLKTVVAWVHLVKARTALSQLQYGEAKKEGQLALDASDKFPDVALQAKSCIGLAQAYSGSAPQGRKLCEEALAEAQKTKSRPLITAAQLALAEVTLLNKDPTTALQTALEAQKIFGQSGQKDSEWRALLIAGRASDQAGDKSAAQGYAKRADQACNEQQQKWGADAYESYLRRPDIQMYRKQLAQLTAAK